MLRLSAPTQPQTGPQQNIEDEIISGMHVADVLQECLNSAKE